MIHEGCSGGEYKPVSAPALGIRSIVGRRAAVSILRDIREAKRMAAVVADVLGVALPPRQEANAVGGEEAEEWVPNPAGMVPLFQEAVHRSGTCIDEPVSHRHGVDAMTEQPTGISDLLGETLAT